MQMTSVLFGVCLSITAFAFSHTEDSYTLYCEKEQVENIGMIPGKIYQEAVKHLPICCVDIFLYDPLRKAYLMVLRKNPPVNGVWWLPGGRLFKGESFFACAERKCKEEAGLEILPLAQAGTYTTIFPDSAWDCQTHTVNTIVVAKVKQQSSQPSLDLHHEDWKWEPIDSPPADPYLYQAYQEALKVIAMQPAS